MNCTRLSLLILLLLLNSCADPEKQIRVSKVILISIDTLRPDFLGAYNSKRDTSPNLDRFAAGNVLFEDASAQATTTAASHKSILYSLYPSVHKTTETTVPTETIQNPLEFLQSQGFRTAAFVGGGQLHPHSGFTKGFHVYRSIQRSGDMKEGISDLIEIEKQAKQWLTENRSGKFFLFLHTYEVHCPYAPPEPYASRYAGWYKGSMDPSGKCGDNYFNDADLNSEDVRYIRDLYAGSVRYTDDFIGRFLQHVKSLGMEDDTMVVLLSDHGESLGEHDYIGHNRAKNVQIKIPMMMRIPGIQSKRISAPVQSIDVMPTIFAALHLNPPYSFQGENLIPVLTGKEEIPKNRLIIAESPQWIRLRRENWAGIFTRKGNPSQIYDLKIDPGEATNLALKRAGVSRRLWNAYLDTIKTQTDIAGHFLVQPGSKSEIPEEVKEQLKALGYIAE